MPMKIIVFVVFSFFLLYAKIQNKQQQQIFYWYLKKQWLSGSADRSENGYSNNVTSSMVFSPISINGQSAERSFHFNTL